MKDPPRLEPEEKLTEEERKRLYAEHDDAVARTVLYNVPADFLVAELVRRGWQEIRYAAQADKIYRVLTEPQE